MRKFVLPLAIVATLATSSMALAVTNNTVTGAIRAIDAKAETVTVGKTVYHFAKGTSLSAFKVGERVVIKAHAYKKIEVGVSIAAAPAAPAPAPTPAPAKTVTKTVTKTTTTK
jgi:hypothetical protein